MSLFIFVTGYGMMRTYLSAACKRLLFVWGIWGILLTGYEVARLDIPQVMRLYEEEAVAVLSGTETKISPEKIHLDFAGDVHVTLAEDGSYQAACNLFGVIPLKTVEIEVVSKEELIPGGISVGIYIETDGVFVIGTGDFETNDGLIESPAKNILKTGDYITSLEGEPVSKKQELMEFLEDFSGEEIILGIRRNEEQLEVSVNPVYIEGKCCLGLWVRDDTQGVGTLTYVSEDGRFGALGHGISDADSNLLMESTKGKLYECEILAIIKGENGAPGKIAGKIVYSQRYLYGEVTENRKVGIYGVAKDKLLQELESEAMPIALQHEVQEGAAVILSAVDGTLKEYTVQISKIHRGERDVNKGMELVVTDERLLELTGGIVQGMSGSPIVQNGKLVGAVTHVLVNDPTRGYGIFIENMLDAVE